MIGEIYQNLYVKQDHEPALLPSMIGEKSHRQLANQVEGTFEMHFRWFIEFKLRALNKKEGISAASQTLLIMNRG